MYHFSQPPNYLTELHVFQNTVSFSLLESLYYFASFCCGNPKLGEAKHAKFLVIFRRVLASLE